MTVILLTGDLAVVSRVQGAASRVGTTVRAVANESAAVEALLADDVSLVVIDLDTSLPSISQFLARIKSAATPPRIIAFGPHVHEERLAAAREAGCDRVLSRGSFFAQLGAILTS